MMEMRATVMTPTAVYFNCDGDGIGVMMMMMVVVVIGVHLGNLKITCHKVTRQMRFFEKA